MGKFDGMDPKLVRDLLAETERATAELRRVEARVTQIMSTAGLSTQTTHRPVQVADAADRMVKDVKARLVVLEKRIDAPKSSLPAVDDPPKPGHPPDAPNDPKPGDKPEGATKPDGKPEADAKPDGKPEADGKPGGDGKPEAGDKPGGKPEADTKPDGKPEGDAKPEGKPEADGKPDAGDKPDGKPEGDGKPEAEAKDEPKDEDRGSRRDHGAEPDRGGERDQDIADTPGKDHPDDPDPSRPQVVEVEGVKVLQIPLDPPTATELEGILDNLDRAQPAEMPSATDDSPSTQPPPTQDDCDNQPGSNQPGGNPSGDGQPRDGSSGEAAVRDAGQNGVGDAPQDGGQGFVVPPTPPPDSAAGADAQSVAGTGVNGDGGDVVSAEARPIDPEALRTMIENAREIQPHTLPGIEGDYGGPGAQGGSPPVGAAGAPDGAVEGAYGDSAVQNDGAPLGADGTPQEGADARQGDTPQAPEGCPQPAPDGSADQDRQPGGSDGRDRQPGGSAGAESGAGAAEGGDGEVVSVEVRPPSAEAIRALVENVREIQPMDMPSVEAPPGEWGRGAWAPEHIEPDGPAGSVDPGAPERSA